MAAQTYTVKKGDTLSAIAKQFGTTYQEIAKANGISNPNKINVGQVLTIGGNNTTTSKTTTPAATNTGFTYTPYEKSDVVKQAEAQVQQHQANNKPGEFQYSYDSQLQENIEKLLNGEKFTYDLNGDALYQQYKDQAMLQGSMASMDVMGQAAAMNGGYGSSYGQTVGHQTYQGYLQQLNDKVPELYQLALSQHNQERQDIKDSVSLLSQQKEKEYGMHRDTVSDYYDELARLTKEARYLDETGYNRYKDNTSMEYTLHSDAKEDASELALSMLSLGTMPTAELLASAGISTTDAQAIVNKVREQNSSGSGGSGGSGSGSSGNKAGSAVGSLANPFASTATNKNTTPQSTYKATPAVNNFEAKIRLKNEFLRGTNEDNQKYKTYNDYIKGMLEKYADDLTDDDIAFIANKYGLK